MYSRTVSISSQMEQVYKWREILSDYEILNVTESHPLEQFMTEIKRTQYTCKDRIHEIDKPIKLKLLDQNRRNESVPCLLQHTHLLMPINLSTESEFWVW